MGSRQRPGRKVNCGAALGQSRFKSGNVSDLEAIRRIAYVYHLTMSIWSSNSSMHAEKDLLLPLVQLLVDYDTKISLRIAVQDAIAQVLSRMSTADVSTTLELARVQRHD
jgi:hypothetical protein